jgi:cytochrome c553
MKLSHLAILTAAFAVTTAIAQQAAAPAAGTDAAAPVPAAETVVAPAPVAVVADTGPAKPGDPKAGQTKAGACAACHNLDGNSALAIYPKLAGQHEQYIWRQLKLYKSGERENAIMLGMSAALTEQDMRDIGAYFSTQKVLAGVADESTVAAGPNAGKKFYQVGEKIYRAGKPAEGVPACAACHGPAGAGMPGPTYPALGGQHAEYTAARLTAFRDGMVWGKDKNANVIMSQAAKNLTDEEIQGLSTYLQGLHKAAKPLKK